MNVFMLSSDTSIFDEQSPARGRMRAYAQGIENFTICISSPDFFSPAHEKNMHFFSAAGRSRIGRLFKLCTVASAELKKMRSAETVITAQDPFEHGLIGILLARFLQLPIEIQVHTDITSKFFQRESFLNRVRLLISKIVLARATTIRVVNESVKRAIGKENVTVLPVWVDIAAAQKATPIDFKKVYPDADPIVYMASRLTPEKQLLCAARAVSALQKEFPYIALVMSGEGPLKNALQKFEVVKLTGWVPDPAAYMKGANIFLLNSLYEGYGRTLLMAVAAHVPLVSTAVGIAPQIIRNNENGFLVDPVDSEAALQRALQSALQKKDWKFSEVAHTTFAEMVAAQQALWRATLAK